MFDRRTNRMGGIQKVFIYIYPSIQLNYKLSWSVFNVRTHVKEAIRELKGRLGKSSYSDVIEYLIDFHRERKNEA